MNTRRRFFQNLGLGLFAIPALKAALVKGEKLKSVPFVPPSSLLGPIITIGASGYHLATMTMCAAFSLSGSRFDAHSRVYPIEP